MSLEPTPVILFNLLRFQDTRLIIRDREIFRNGAFRIPYDHRDRISSASISLAISSFSRALAVVERFNPVSTVSDTVPAGFPSSGPTVATEGNEENDGALTRRRRDVRSALAPRSSLAAYRVSLYAAPDPSSSPRRWPCS